MSITFCSDALKISKNVFIWTHKKPIGTTIRLKKVEWSENEILWPCWSTDMSTFRWSKLIESKVVWIPSLLSALCGMLCTFLGCPESRCTSVHHCPLDSNALFLNYFWLEENAGIVIFLINHPSVYCQNTVDS